MNSVIRNLLCVDPLARWDANLVLVHAQQEFIKDIQRVFRGFKARKEVKRMREGLVRIQAMGKCFVTRKRYRQVKELRKDQAATMIQARWRAYVCRKEYLHKYKLI
jgi:myosin heavy subunit